jgi:hypothetical protein
MADRRLENKQKGKKVCKSFPLLAILHEGPQKKFLLNLIINYAVKFYFIFT